MSPCGLCHRLLEGAIILAFLEAWIKGLKEIIKLRGTRPRLKSIGWHCFPVFPGYSIFSREASFGLGKLVLKGAMVGRKCIFQLLVLFQSICELPLCSETFLCISYDLFNTPQKQYPQCRLAASLHGPSRLLFQPCAVLVLQCENSAPRRDLVMAKCPLFSGLTPKPHLKVMSIFLGMWL